MVGDRRRPPILQGRAVISDEVATIACRESDLQLAEVAG
jgi:hypothetical protein